MILVNTYVDHVILSSGYHSTQNSTQTPWLALQDPCLAIHPHPHSSTPGPQAPPNSAALSDGVYQALSLLKPLTLTPPPVKNKMFFSVPFTQLMPRPKSQSKRYLLREIFLDHPSKIRCFQIRTMPIFYTILLRT